MFRNKIRSKSLRVRIDWVRFCAGKPGCIGLAFGLDQMKFCVERGMQMVFHVASLGRTHGGSSRSVAYLKDARLAQVWSAEGEKGQKGYCFEHTPIKLRVPETPKGSLCRMLIPTTYSEAFETVLLFGQSE